MKPAQRECTEPREQLGAGEACRLLPLPGAELFCSLISMWAGSGDTSSIPATVWEQAMFRAAFCETASSLSG